MLTAPPLSALRRTLSASGTVGSVLTDRAKRPGRRSISCFALSSSVAGVRRIALVTPQPCICVKHASASFRRCKWVSSTGPPQSGADCAWTHGAWTHGAKTPRPTVISQIVFASCFTSIVQSTGWLAAGRKRRHPHHVSPFAICARSQSSFRSRPRPGPSGTGNTLFRTTGSGP